MNNITLNIGGGIGAAVGAVLGAGIGLVVAPPTSPNFPNIAVKCALFGLVGGAIAMNFLWDAMFKKKP